MRKARTDTPLKTDARHPACSGTPAGAERLPAAVRPRGCGACGADARPDCRQGNDQQQLPAAGRVKPRGAHGGPCPVEEWRPDSAHLQALVREAKQTPGSERHRVWTPQSLALTMGEDRDNTSCGRRGRGMQSQLGRGSGGEYHSGQERESTGDDLGAGPLRGQCDHG